MISRMKGIVPVVVTPLKPNGDVDAESCASLVNYLVDGGAAGLFALGSASENFLLDIEQRIEVTKAMAEANDGRIPLIVGCANTAPRNVERFLSAIEGYKVAGVHFIPYDLKIGDQCLIDMAKYYADRSPFPLYLYHNVKRGRPITIDVAKKLKKHPNIWGIKVGGYSLGEMIKFLSIDDEDFQVMGSGGGQFLPWLMLGAEAVTASSASCFPRLFREIFDLFMAGDIKGAEEKQLWWRKFHSSIPNTAPSNGEYAAEEKHILFKKGIIKFDNCHFPYRGLTQEEMVQVDAALASAGDV